MVQGDRAPNRQDVYPSQINSKGQQRPRRAPTQYSGLGFRDTRPRVELARVNRARGPGSTSVASTWEVIQCSPLDPRGSVRVVSEVIGRPWGLPPSSGSHQPGPTGGRAGWMVNPRGCSFSLGEPVTPPPVTWVVESSSILQRRGVISKKSGSCLMEGRSGNMLRSLNGVMSTNCLQGNSAWIRRHNTCNEKPPVVVSTVLSIVLVGEAPSTSDHSRRGVLEVFAYTSGARCSQRKKAASRLYGVGDACGG